MLQVLKVRLGQRPSFTGKEDSAPHARVEHMTTGLVRGVAGNFFICRYFSVYEQLKFCAQLS